MPEEEDKLDEIVKTFISPKAPEPEDKSGEEDDEGKPYVPDLDTTGKGLAATITLLEAQHGKSEEGEEDDETGGEEETDEEKAARIAAEEKKKAEEEETEEEKAAREEAEAKAAEEKKAREAEEAKDPVAAITFEDEKTPPATPKGEEEEEKKPKAPVDSEEDQEFIGSFSDEERFSLTFYAEAEEVDPKYKGLRKKQLTYLKDHRAKVEELRKSEPSTPVEENPDYQAFVEQNRPVLSPWQVEEVRTAIATKRARESTSQELEAIKATQRRQELVPQVKQEVTQFSTSLTAQLPEDMLTVFNETAEKEGAAKAVEAMAEEFPEESAAALAVYKEVQAEAEAILLTQRGVESYNPENPVHARAAEKILTWENHIAHGGEKTSKYRTDPKGRKFATYQEFAAMSEDERPKHFTLTTKQVLSMLAADGKNLMEEAVKTAVAERNKMFERYGIDPSTVKRTAKKKVTKDPPAKKKKAPKSSSTPAPGHDKKKSASKDPVGSFMVTGKRD